MKPHKWAKEIKAWADGATIECFNESKSLWEFCMFPEWEEELYFRVAPTQPKEPQYLYVYANTNGEPMIFAKKKPYQPYLGKIKLEQDDEKL